MQFPFFLHLTLNVSPMKYYILLASLVLCLPVLSFSQGADPYARDWKKVDSLFEKGLPVSVGITFLLAAPFMNPIVFASTYIAFGFGPIFIGRFLITAVVSAAVGLIFALTAKPNDVLQSGVILQETGWEDLQPRRSFEGGVQYALATAAGLFKAVIGMALVLISHLVSKRLTGKGVW